MIVCWRKANVVLSDVVDEVDGGLYLVDERKLAAAVEVQDFVVEVIHVDGLLLLLEDLRRILQLLGQRVLRSEVVGLVHQWHHEKFAVVNAGLGQDAQHGRDNLKIVRASCRFNRRASHDEADDCGASCTNHLMHQRQVRQLLVLVGVAEAGAVYEEQVASLVECHKVRRLGAAL